jgi:hypothetical protein
MSLADSIARPYWKTERSTTERIFRHRHDQTLSRLDALNTLKRENMFTDWITSKLRLTALTSPPDLVELFAEDVIFGHLAEGRFFERVPVCHVGRKRSTIGGDGVVHVGRRSGHAWGHHRPPCDIRLHRGRVAGPGLHR